MSCVWALNLKRANWHEVKWAAGGRKKLLRALQVAIALPAWNSIDMETNFGLVLSGDEKDCLTPVDENMSEEEQVARSGGIWSSGHPW